jgi:hypothetical protein
LRDGEFLRSGLVFSDDNFSSNVNFSGVWSFCVREVFWVGYIFYVFHLSISSIYFIDFISFLWFIYLTFPSFWKTFCFHGRLFVSCSLLLSLGFFRVVCNVLKGLWGKWCQYWRFLWSGLQSAKSRIQSKILFILKKFAVFSRVSLHSLKVPFWAMKRRQWTAMADTDWRDATDTLDTLDTATDTTGPTSDVGRHRSIGARAVEDDVSDAASWGTWWRRLRWQLSWWTWGASWYDSYLPELNTVQWTLVPLDDEPRMIYPIRTQFLQLTPVGQIR